LEQEDDDKKGEGEEEEAEEKVMESVSMHWIYPVQYPEQGKWYLLKRPTQTSLYLSNIDCSSEKCTKSHLTIKPANYLST
jgi:hypothetical protein